MSLSSKDFGEDAAFLLYLVPVVVSIIYGIVEWVAISATSSMPTNAYLIVAKSPYLFLISILAICLAIIIEVRSTASPERNGIIQANISRLQYLAIVVLIISLFASISAGGYNLGTAISLFVNGRYALIYAFFLIGISLLLAPKQILGNLKLASVPDILGLILLVAGPILFYLGLKVHLSFSVSAIGGLIVGILGFVLLFMGITFPGKKPQQTVTTSQKQPVTSGVIGAKQPVEKS
jgi:hypothetical protein